jgi:hypothetical protein
MLKPGSHRTDLPPPPSDAWSVECYGRPATEGDDNGIAVAEATEPRATPAAVQLAILFECAAVALLGADWVLADIRGAQASTALGHRGFLIVAGAAALLLYGLSTRREWARMALWASAVVLGFLVFPTLVAAVRSGHTSELRLVALWALHAGAAALLFWPGNVGWFSQSRAGARVD